MFKIILTLITLALIFTACNHNQKDNTNSHIETYYPDYGLDNDNDSISNNPLIAKIPEPSFLFSYGLISVLCVTLKLNQLQK
jgi:PBP1b-binding outer membrane lipoprotein LpoB